MIYRYSRATTSHGEFSRATRLSRIARPSGTGAGVADAAGEPGGTDGHGTEPGGDTTDHGSGALAEVHDRPAVAAGLALERAVRVDRHRVTDRPQHREVARRVAGRRGLGEVGGPPTGGL